MHEGADNSPGRSRRGLGFLAPAVHIRSHTPQLQEAAPREWAAWKEWNINPAGHGGYKGPPVFVLAENSYDDLGRSVADGFDVDVEEGEMEKDREGKEAGAAVADWYRSISTSVSKAASPSPSPAPTENPRPTQPASLSSATAPAPLSTISSSAPSPGPSVSKIRIHRSEWFIRRALVSAAKTNGSLQPSVPGPPPSIGSMLNIDSAKPAPPPIPHYALGPENVGFSRLAALGWGGGGLGRPEGWTEDDEARDRARAELRCAEGERPLSAPPEVDGVVDLTADSEPEDHSEGQEEEAIRHGPGRTAPIATALKFNRLGLGRVASDKRVSHSHAEIERARLRGAGKRHDGKSEPSKKAKVKWAERDKRDREHRARIAAALR